jgi:hypothetical protein
MQTDRASAGSSDIYLEAYSGTLTNHRCFHTLKAGSYAADQRTAVIEMQAIAHLLFELQCRADASGKNGSPASELASHVTGISYSLLL